MKQRLHGWAEVRTQLSSGVFSHPSTKARPGRLSVWSASRPRLSLRKVTLLWPPAIPRHWWGVLLCWGSCDSSADHTSHRASALGLPGAPEKSALPGTDHFLLVGLPSQASPRRGPPGGAPPTPPRPLAPPPALSTGCQSSDLPPARAAGAWGQDEGLPARGLPPCGKSGNTFTVTSVHPP